MIGQDKKKKEVKSSVTPTALTHTSVLTCKWGRVDGKWRTQPSTESKMLETRNLYVAMFLLPRLIPHKQNGTTFSCACASGWYLCVCVRERERDHDIKGLVGSRLFFPASSVQDSISPNMNEYPPSTHIPFYTHIATNITMRRKRSNRDVTSVYVCVPIKTFSCTILTSLLWNSFYALDVCRRVRRGRKAGIHPDLMK